jgi:peroxiredoxin
LPKRFASVCLLIILQGIGLGICAWGQPRKAPELAFVKPAGDTISNTSLSELAAGKVVLIEFLLPTDCPSCERLAITLNDLHRELEPQGFQALGIVVGPLDVKKIQTFGRFLQDANIGFSVGYTSQQAVQSFLGILPSSGYVVPQVAIIDRNGLIRNQSIPMGSAYLQDGDYLRNRVVELLAEAGVGRETRPVFNGQAQVPPGQQYRVPLTTASNLKGGRLAGNVSAQGGAGNDIRVLVMRGQAIAFDSGPRRSVVFSVDCSEPGAYTVVFDNSFSLLSPKVVTGTISLVHSGVDVGRDEADRKEAEEHFRVASSVLQRLFVAMKADEGGWGTSQLLGMPSIRMNRDASINAAANWTTNTIQVNKGLFGLTDAVGQKGEDVLAATLSHELSHIFYRHAGYGSTSQGLKGLFDELRGVTALDRIQEAEADVLGIRVACQAGFDPQGMLILMRVFGLLDPTADSFMKNHPSAVQRINYLRGEVAACEAHRQ